MGSLPEDPPEGAMLTFDNELLMVAFLALRYVRAMVDRGPLQAPHSLPCGGPGTLFVIPRVLRDRRRGQEAEVK